MTSGMKLCQQVVVRVVSSVGSWAVIVTVACDMSVRVVIVNGAQTASRHPGYPIGAQRLGVGVGDLAFGGGRVELWNCGNGGTALVAEGKQLPSTDESIRGRWRGVGGSR